jgi:hypothetical protein
LGCGVEDIGMRACASMGLVQQTQVSIAADYLLEQLHIMLPFKQSQKKMTSNQLTPLLS